MAINTKFVMSLSLNSIEEYKKMLEEYKEQIPKVAERIVDRITDIGLEENYSSVIKLPIETTIEGTVGGIKTTDIGTTFAEFGTGIVGSAMPHVNPEWLAKSGWEYDVGEHIDSTGGWTYYKDGKFHYTHGQPAQNRFYNATLKMENSFNEIAKEEMQKIFSK